MSAFFFPSSLRDSNPPEGRPPERKAVPTETKAKPREVVPMKDSATCYPPVGTRTTFEGRPPEEAASEKIKTREKKGALK
jgi:hypothetical protein